MSNSQVTWFCFLRKLSLNSFPFSLGRAWNSCNACTISRPSFSSLKLSIHFGNPLSFLLTFVCHLGNFALFAFLQTFFLPLLRELDSCIGLCDFIQLSSLQRISRSKIELSYAKECAKLYSRSGVEVGSLKAENPISQNAIRLHSGCL